MITKNPILPIIMILFLGIAASHSKENTFALPQNIYSDTSRIIQDWEGSYKGVVPCADCEGIKTLITLNENRTFTMETIYQGKSDQVSESKGVFKWNQEEKKVLLKPINHIDGPKQYLIGENILIPLDVNGNKIVGDLADNYILEKIDDLITNRYWKLIEIYGNSIEKTKEFRYEPYIVMHAGGHRLTGNGGCNTFNGSYFLHKEGLFFGQGFNTKMICENLDIEDQLFTVLKTADNYTLNSNVLTLNKAGMAPLAKFKLVKK